MSYKYLVTLIFISLASAVTGYFFASKTKDRDAQNNTVPKVYVERCAFPYEGENCGEKAKNVIFFSSDEFLGFTQNWAVGRVESYKVYMSCFDPGDDNYTDGTHSLLTVVVAGEELLGAHEMSKQLLHDFSNELSEQSKSVAHCLESGSPLSVQDEF